MTEIQNTQDVGFQNAHKNNSESEAYILTQVQVDEQIKNSIAPVNKQLYDLTPLIQGMTQFQQQSLTPTAINNARSATAGTSSDDQSNDQNYTPVKSSKQYRPNEGAKLRFQNGSFKN